MKDEMGVWLPWLCVLGLLATTSGDQCHNSPCTQTNFREYSNCIQSSCSYNNNCLCSNVRCDSCQTSDQCCGTCCSNRNTVQSSCNNNCQGNNCQSNCQSNNCQSNCQSTTCRTPDKVRTCADINCQTCQGDECMAGSVDCCKYSVTTQQSVKRPQTQSPTPCNVTNIFKPEIQLPNITITVNQPPIYIRTGPVLNNISVPCPNPRSLTCPTPNNTIIYVQPNSTNCCQVPSTRCVPTSNPASPYCYNYQQQACGAQCPYTSPPQYMPPPAPVYIPAPAPQYVPPPPPQYVQIPAPPPQYVLPPQPQYIPPPLPQYIPAPAPQYIPAPAPQYIPAPAPQYIPVPQPQYIPAPAPRYIQPTPIQYVAMPAPQCPATGCQPALQPYYQPYAVLPPRQPCPWYGCQTPCAGTGCGRPVGGGYNPPTGGNIAAVPLPGAPAYPYYMPTNYGTQYSVLPNGTYVVVTGDPSLNPTVGGSLSDGLTKGTVAAKKSGGGENEN